MAILVKTILDRVLKVLIPITCIKRKKMFKDELFSAGAASHVFTYTCSFDYNNSVDKVHNTPTAKDKAIVGWIGWSCR